MPELSHQEIEELLGAFALDAVDGPTAEIIETHLEGCESCAVEVAQHHEVAGLLANSGGDSSSAVWDGIASRLAPPSTPIWERLSLQLGNEGDLAETDERADHDAGAVVGGLSQPVVGGAPEGATITTLADRAPRRRVATWVAGGIAAAAAVVALVLGAQVHTLHQQVNALSTPTARMEQAALHAPGTRRIALTASVGSTAPREKVTILLTSTGTGFVEGTGLGGLPSDKTYQLWGVVDGKAISLGLLGTRPSVVPFSVAGHAPVEAFAITVEHAGGVVRSNHQPVVSGLATA